jgi:hypothetical protein
MQPLIDRLQLAQRLVSVLHRCNVYDAWEWYLYLETFQGLLNTAHKVTAASFDLITVSRGDVVNFNGYRYVDIY